jgi:hypothetical protein
MDDYLDYFSETARRAWRATLSWLGLGGALLFFGVEHFILKVGGQNVTILLELVFAFLIVFVLMLIWEMRAAFSYIKLIPVIERDLKHNHDIACLLLESNEPTKMICSAKLVQAEHLFSMGNVLYRHPQKVDVLEWLSQNQDEDKSCEISIQPFDKTRKISVAQYNNGIVLTYCHGPREIIGHGVILIKIRVDGFRIEEKNRSIWPRYFQGYVHAFNVVDGKYNFAALKIRAGDWRNDDEIPIEVRAQKQAT